MHWIYLTIAGLLEIGWAIGLKYTDGFTRVGPTLLTLAAVVASMFFLALAVRTIPIGTAYAIWTGIGVVGTVILGMVLFAEPASLPRLLFLTLIVVGILGVKLTTGT